jgi:hypothetical protein
VDDCIPGLDLRRLLVGLDVEGESVWLAGFGASSGSQSLSRDRAPLSPFSRDTFGQLFDSLVNIRHRDPNLGSDFRD